jgi:hypothetical protein
MRINKNAKINHNSYGRLQTLPTALFKIRLAMRRDFLKIYWQSGQASSKRSANTDLEGMTKNKIHFSKYSRCLDEYSNQTPCESKYRLLQQDLHCSTFMPVT